MSYILWVELEGFYVEHHDAQGKPLIVAREKVVLDANRLAKRHGVLIGMPIRQAKTLAPDCLVTKWAPETYLEKRTKWLDVCTEFSGIIEPIDQHIAALDLTNHPNPFDIAERVVRRLVRQTNLSIRYGAGSSLWIAKLASHRQDLGRAIDSPADFLAPLSIDDLYPAEPAHRSRLAFLGYRTIGDVAKLPLDVLQAQFGEAAHVIRSAAQGRAYQPVRPLYPHDSMHECLTFEGGVDDQQTIDNGLQELAARIGKRLADKGLQGSTLSIKVDTENDLIARERKFTKPIHNPLSALIALRLLVQGTIEAPVLGIQIRLAELEKSRNRQQELAGFSMRSTRPDPIAAVGYVRTVFGDDALKLAGQIEVPRRVRVLKEWQSATGWR